MSLAPPQASPPPARGRSSRPATARRKGIPLTPDPRSAVFAIPGDIATPTGGYGYARRLLAEAGAAGLALTHLPLPAGYPDPSAADLAETARLLGEMPADRTLLIDGLAYGAFPAELLRAIPAPVVALCHHPLGLESGLAPDRAEALIATETAALAHATQVIATSRTTAETLTRQFAVAPEKITVAPPGTDPAPPARGSGGATAQLLSVGSLTERKGHDVLIAALSRLAGLDWQLRIVGPVLDPEYARSLETQIAATGLGQRIALAGPAGPAELEAAYLAADIFVLASRFEGYGMAYTEALAHGLPVVGCDSGAVAEATRGRALLAPPDDPAALAGALRPLIQDRDARKMAAGQAQAAAAALPRWPETARLVAEAIAKATR